MFNVTTVNLSSDTTIADVAFGSSVLGNLAEDEVIALLERFRRIDPLQNNESDPHLLIEANAGRFLIRTGRNKLFLYNARDTTQPYAELEPAELLRQIDRAATSVAAAAAPSEITPGVKAAPHYGIAFAILVAGLALNGYTLYSVFYTETVNQKPPVTLLTAEDELRAREKEVVGTYATGEKPGDRVITVLADSTLRFSEIGARSMGPENSDTYRLGRHDKKLCLLTLGSGVVDVVGVDTLSYYRDIYRRTK